MIGAAEDVGIAGRETEGMSQLSDGLAVDAEALVRVLRLLRVVEGLVDDPEESAVGLGVHQVLVQLVASTVGLGVHQVLVQLDASGAAESEIVSVAAMTV